MKDNNGCFTVFIWIFCFPIMVIVGLLGILYDTGKKY